jgi:hypothetical protein
MLRPGHTDKGEHAATFSFNRGCKPLQPLYAASSYSAAAKLAMAGPELSRMRRMLTAEERCRALRATLQTAGMDCRPLGRAMVVWNTEAE